MASTEHLLGYLTARFSSQPENLATEALAFILGRSVAARAAFSRFVRQMYPACPELVAFHTQVQGDDGAIPDLVALDEYGNHAVLVEAKFWAGLTDNQPLTYLAHVGRRTSGLLLFLVPAARFQTLWPELRSRCSAAGLALKGERTDGELRCVTIEGVGMLAMAGWGTLLSSIRVSVESAKEWDTASDVVQLESLCNRMDQSAFLPLRSPELASVNGRRVVEYCDIVDDVTNAAVGDGFISIAGLRASGSKGWYGRYMTVAGYECRLCFSAYRWAEYRETPIWFDITSRDTLQRGRAQEALASLELDDPPRLITPPGEVLVPFDVPLAAERHEVVKSLTEQLRRIANLLHAKEFSRN